MNTQKPLKLHINENHILKESRPDVFDNSIDSAYGNLVDSNSKVGKVSTHDYYKFEKGKDAIINWLTADEYIDKCIRKIFRSNYNSVVTNGVNQEVVNKYAELMKNGTKFPTPYLDFTGYRGQEGRHRALAFKQAFGDDAEIPVIEIYPTHVTDDEIYDYCKQRWGDGYQWFGYVASGLGRTEQDIENYLNNR